MRAARYSICGILSSGGWRERFRSLDCDFCPSLCAVTRNFRSCDARKPRLRRPGTAANDGRPSFSLSFGTRVQDNKLEKRNDAVVSGHQFFRNDTGAASRSVGRPFHRGGGRRATVMIPGPAPPAPFLRPVVYQVPLRITSIKTLGAPRWSRRSRPPFLSPAPSMLVASTFRGCCRGVGALPGMG